MPSAPPHEAPLPHELTRVSPRLPGSGPHALKVSAVEQHPGLGNKAPGTVLDLETLLSSYLLAS